MCTELSQQCVAVAVATARYHPPLLVEVAEQEGSGPVKPGREFCMLWSRVFRCGSQILRGLCKKKRPGVRHLDVGGGMVPNRSGVLKTRKRGAWRPLSWWV